MKIKVGNTEIEIEDHWMPLIVFGAIAMVVAVAGACGGAFSHGGAFVK